MLRYSQKKVVASRVLEVALAALRPFTTRRRPVPRGDAATVVLVEGFQLGDVLSLAVMLDPIRERYPAGRIIVWCHSKNAQVYRNDPRVYKVMHAPFAWSNRGSKRGDLKGWIAVLQSCLAMRREHPDVTIDPRGDIRSQMLMVLGGSAHNIGYSTYVGSNLKLRGLLLDEVVGEPGETHRYLTNLIVLGPLLGSIPELRLPALRLEHNAVKPARKLVLVHPGAGWVFKQWAPARWAALIDRLRGLGAFEIRMIAGPGERELCAMISSLAAQPIEIVSTSFEELLTTIASASLFLGLDSGPMNAAVLLNIPVIALFGPGQSEVWRPLSAGSQYFHKLDGYPCYPCTQMVCVRPEDSCMTPITVDEVFQASSRVLTGGLISIR